VIFNTKCCIGIQQKCPNEAVQEITVARYFYDHFLVKVAEILKNRLDISGLNEQCRKIASAGYKDNKSSKQSCYDCNKEIKTGKSHKCHMCKKHIHMACAEKSIAFLDDMLTANEFSCTSCVKEPNYIEDNPVEDLASNLIQTVQQMCILGHVNESDIVLISDGDICRNVFQDKSSGI
jgi:hypothetical protein